MTTRSDSTPPLWARGPPATVTWLRSNGNHDIASLIRFGRVDLAVRLRQ